MCTVLQIDQQSLVTAVAALCLYSRPLLTAVWCCTQVCAGVQSGDCTGGASDRCQVGPGLPRSRHLQTYNWWRVKHNDRWLLLVQVDRVTERSGPICCYRSAQRLPLPGLPPREPPHLPLSPGGPSRLSPQYPVPQCRAAPDSSAEIV